MDTTDDIVRTLNRLQDEYTFRVNVLLDQGREDLAAALATQYLEERDRVQRDAERRPAA